MNKKNIIQEIYKENSTYSSPRQAEMVANLLETVSSDIYSESQRFVFELIQNADDAAKDTNNVVHFDFLNKCLIVSHNGKPFDDNDIISLTSAGASTKRADPTKTGYKGIGFKSVFGKSERVTIFSDDYQFRFDKSVHKSKLPWQIIPIWTELDDLSAEIQNSLTRNKYTVSTIIEIKNPDTLIKDLKELLNNGQILLFLRQVSKISISINGKIISSIEKKIISQNNDFNEVSLHKEGKEISLWLTKTFEKIPITPETKEALMQDEKTPEKLKEAEFTEISFAAKIEEGKLMPLKKNESLIFTYLPTKVEDFEFPFLINGSFLTNAARERLHEDRIWNQWLFKLTAEKIIDWLELLAAGKFKTQILHLLPTKFNSVSNELKTSFNKTLEKVVKEKAFIPAKNSKLKKASDIIVDKTGLSDLPFIATETLIDFINQKEKRNFYTDSFANAQLEHINKLRTFGAYFFDSENLESFFLSSIFRNKHKTTENFALIEYFHKKASKEESKEWNEKLKSIPFIYAKGKKLKSPQTVCFPSIAFETEFGEGVTVVHNDVYPHIENNSKIKSWLEWLGVKEPSDTAYLENEIISNIENCIDKDNYPKVTRYIFNQHKKGLLSELHYNQLQELKLFTTSKDFKAAKECYLTDFYEPLLKLQNVNKAGNYVSETYKQQEDLISEWKTLFLKIGVQETISWSGKSYSREELSGKYPDYFTRLPSGSPNSLYGYQNEFYRYDVNSWTFIEFANSYEFAKPYWENVIKNNLSIESEKSDKGICYYPRVIESFNKWYVLNMPIFPSTLNKCFCAEDIFINDKEITHIAGKHLPVFDYDMPLPEEWRTILPFKTKLDLTDYLIVLEKIAEQTEEKETLSKSNLKKIGLIYNKLASLLPDFSDDKKKIVTDWAKENKLLSSNGKFEIASELKWIKIDGFSNTSEKLKTIQLPENCDSQSSTFEEFISLLDVQIIDKFTPTFETKKRDFDLHRKLQNILPYFVTIIEKKQYADYTKEFERLFSIISNGEFYNSKSIKLSFTYLSETIVGASLNVFQEQNKLYFKGKWNSPITMFNLIPELSNLLKVYGLNDELRLLLELDESEIAEWFIGLGYDLSVVKAKPEFHKAQKGNEITTISKLQPNTEPVSVVSESDFEGDYEGEFESENFEPVSTPKDFDTSKISVTKKAFLNSNQVAEANYSEIQSQEVRENVGRWSEEFVNEFLSKNKSNLTEIIWMNKDEESGMPYDFKIVDKGIEKFIDVKGTPSKSKGVVYLSPNEWRFMFDKGMEYSIYRVYNAGQQTVRIEIIENPSDLLIKGIIYPIPITLKV